MSYSIKYLEEAHKASSYHRATIKHSKMCGCFYCCKTFSPTLIKEWIDGGQTAVCPSPCGIDSVIGSASGYKLTDGFLKAMCKFWFNRVEINGKWKWLKSKDK